MKQVQRLLAFILITISILSASSGQEAVEDRKEMTEVEIQAFLKLMSERIERDIPLAKEKGRSVTEKDVAAIIELSLELIANDSNEDFPHKKYLKHRGTIPEGWQFLDPKALYVGSDYVEVWLYRNAMNNDLPQVYFNVSKKEGSLRVEYYEELNSEPLKAWNKEEPIRR